jgi:hypothetical protein
MIAVSAFSNEFIKSFSGVQLSRNVYHSCACIFEFTRPIYNQRYHQDRQVDQNSYPALTIQSLKPPFHKSKKTSV